jgi:O-antigen/teichoic acid export membrane protein
MLSLGTGISQGLTAVLFILTARSSPVETFGLVATSIAIGMVAAGLLDFGFNSLLTRELASGNIGLTEFWARANGKVLVGAGLAAMWVSYGMIFDGYHVVAALVFLFVLVFQTSLVPLRATSESLAISLLFIWERTVAIAVFFSLLLLNFAESQALVVSLLTGTGMATTLSILTLHRKGILGSGGLPRIWPWRGAHGYGLSSSANALQQLDLPLITLFAGPAASGIYASVSKWTQPLGVVANAFATAATPFIAKADSIRDSIMETRKAAWLIILACACSGFLVPLAPLIVELMLGPAYLGSVQVLQLLAIGTVPAILNQVFAAGLQARGFDHQVAVTNVSGVTLQLFIVVCTAGFLGAIAGAIAYCLLQVGMLITLSLVLNRKLKLEPKP